jgi:excisionase family DNA binding protein
LADSPLLHSLRLLRRSDVAWRLNCSTDTVRRLAQRGKLTERRVGNLVRYLPEEVAALEGGDQAWRAA